MTIANVILVITATLTALMAGLFFAWSCSVMPGFARLKDREFVAAMQAANRAIQNPVFFAAFFGAPIFLINITLLPLPPRAPELNPVENVWQYLRDNWLGSRIFASYEDIVDQCCCAWNNLIERPWMIMSIGLRQWAHEC